MLAKREVRHRARERRRELARTLEVSGERVAAGRLIAERVLAALPEAGARGSLRIAAYESLPDEPPTGPLIQALIEAGHEVIVPITLQDFSLEWRPATAGSVGDRTTMTRAALPAGVVTLGPGALGTCDLIIVPGLSVDPVGVRLGQGGGCYDRALVHRDPRTPVFTLLHEGEQTHEPLPRSDHDQLVDGYLTTSGHLVTVDHERPGEGESTSAWDRNGPAGLAGPATGSRLREG